jgi:flagellar P-ring protein precursor FlgI
MSFIRIAVPVLLLLALPWAAMADGGAYGVPGVPQDRAPRTTPGLSSEWGDASDPLLASYGTRGGSTRLKDISRVQSVRGNQLIGYSLVVGLAGTGDGQQTSFPIASLRSMLKQFGINPDADNIRVDNIAAVVVTADLPPFAKPGDTIDVTVSSIGDADSLQGGVLLQTPLQGADGEVYAVAQGEMSIGGYNETGAGGGQVRLNHPTVGMIPNGAYVEREVPTSIAEGNSVFVTLFEADFTTASRAAKAINEEMDDVHAAAVDAATIKVSANNTSAYGIVDLVAELENVRLDPDNRARIVINERTGDIAMTGQVRVMPGAVSHGSLQVEIRPEPVVVQPPPLSSGATVVLPNATPEVTETGGPFMAVGGTSTIDDVIASLNALGAQTRDMIAILQAMKAAGLLLADVEVR